MCIGVGMKARTRTAAAEKQASRDGLMKRSDCRHGHVCARERTYVSLITQIPLVRVLATMMKMLGSIILKNG